ncbi:MAG: hypothetical protein ACLTW6_06655 [Enterobacter sp.]
MKIMQYEALRAEMTMTITTLPLRPITLLPKHHTLLRQCQCMAAPGKRPFAIATTGALKKRTISTSSKLT